jgi:hypothetical protein
VALAGKAAPGAPLNASCCLPARHCCRALLISSSCAVGFDILPTPTPRRAAPLCTAPHLQAGGGGGGGGEDNKEKERMMASLSSAIVQEKPNVKVRRAS